MVDALYFVVGICFLTLLFRMTLEVIDVVTGFNIIGFLKKIKGKLTQNKEAYKDFVRTTESYGRVVELPFSVVQPLLRDDSPMILVAQSDRLALKDGPTYSSSIFIKLSKEDYADYIKFLEQKKTNKEQLKKTEDTLAATELINKELKRINEEALKSVQKNTDDIKNITELYIGPEHSKELKEIINEHNAKIEKHFCTDGTVYEFERSTKFDWELANDVLTGKTAIVMNDITEYFQFRTSGLTDIIHCNTSNTTGYPRVAYYSRVTDQWFIEPYGTRIFNATVNITELFKCCPDCVRIFNRKIQDEGRNYDRL